MAWEVIISRSQEVLLADSVNNQSGKVCEDSTKFNVKVFKYGIVQN